MISDSAMLNVNKKSSANGGSGRIIIASSSTTNTGAPSACKEAALNLLPIKVWLSAWIIIVALLFGSSLGTAS